MPSTTQGPTQPTGGGDQPLEKNIPLEKTCHDGSRPIIGTQVEEKKEEEKKIDEPNDSAATPLVPSPHDTPVPSPHATLVPSPHATLVPSPPHSPVTLEQCSGSPI